jgi:hypothetical protein
MPAYSKIGSSARTLAGTQLPFDIPVAQAIGERQNQARAEHIPAGSVRDCAQRRLAIPIAYRRGYRITRCNIDGREAAVCYEIDGAE